jgi:ribosome-binding factor A
MSATKRSSGQGPPRSVRVGERVREELASIVALELRDPRLEGAAITDVSMTPDLQLARVRVRLVAVDPKDEASKRRALIAGLTSASGMLRREIAQRLGLRFAPKLTFHYDESPEAKDRIDRLLDEIAKEPKARE